MMLSRVTAASAVIVALVGWAFAAYQLVTDRWVGATALLLVAAVGATVGASVVVVAVIRARVGALIAGLLLVAVSASVFAYPLSAVALLLLVTYTGRAISQRHRSPHPAV
jgi:hypothetical protein